MSIRNDDLPGARTDYSPPPVTYHTAGDPKRGRKIGGALIVVGIVLLIAGAAVATVPMSWKSAKDIADNWVGGAIGYYGSYDDGSKVTVLGEISFEIPVTLILADNINYTSAELESYQDLENMGYDYVYYLDDVYALEFYSKTDLGNAGDEVALEFTLNSMDLGGMNYWTWTARSIEKPNATLYYALGIPLLVLGLVVAAFGASKYLSAKKTEASQGGRAETQYDYSMRSK